MTFIPHTRKRLEAAESRLDEHDQVLKALTGHLSEIATRFAGIERKILLLGVALVVAKPEVAEKLVGLF